MNKVELKRQLLKARIDDAYGEGTAEMILLAPTHGKTLGDLATDLGVTKQYISFVYQKLTGETWFTAVTRQGINPYRRRKP